MNDIRWTPGRLQLLVPVCAHALGCAAVLIVSSWYPHFAWVLIAVAASFAFELRRVVRLWRKPPMELRVLDNRLWLPDDAIWRRLDLRQAWLGPYLVVLRARTERDAWWIYRAELGSPHDALLRRTLRSAGDRLKHVERVEHRAP